MLNLINGDCMEALKSIETGSVDLVATDPPYNIKKAHWDKWKTVSAYVDFMGEVFLECQRVLKDNGTLYFWHNDFAQMARLQIWIEENTRFKLNSIIHWTKRNHRTIAWKNPSKNSTLRSWFPCVEYCMFYTFEDGSGLSKIMLDVDNFRSLRDYFYDMRCYMGKGKPLPKKRINEDMGHRKAEHCFYSHSTQWDMPTRETYAQLVETYNLRGWGGFREYDGLREGYDGLREEYDELREEYEKERYAFNLAPLHNNIWTSEDENSRKEHPTQKPLDLMKRIVRCSTHPGGVVLDPFMGSGTTGVAACGLGRSFIGVEREEKYFKIAQRRCENVQPDLF